MNQDYLTLPGMDEPSTSKQSSAIIVPELQHRSQKLLQVLNSIPDVESDNENEDDMASSLVVLQNANPSFLDSPRSKVQLSTLTDALNNLDQMSFSLERLLTDKLEKIDAREIEINEELQQIRKLVDVSDGSLTRNTSCFGMPYFKTQDLQPYPPNEDHLTKVRNDELITYDLSVSTTWNSKEIGIIQKAVAECIVEKELHKINMKIQATIKDQAAQKREYQKAWVLWNSKPLSELVTNDDEEFDWLKIAIYSFQDKHSPEECQRMWHLYAKPSVIKSRWSQEEDQKLKQIAKENKYQDWDTIAKKLNTGRSGYQCFVQFQKRLCVFKKTGKWTAEEDKLLNKIVDQCRIGSYIPWSKVMYYFENRTLRQVFNRWSYSLNPALKKGQFTRSEDFGLCVGVQLYGKNFCKIANILGNRSAVQIRERYKSKMNESNSGSWTKEEDMKLIDLVNNHGGKKWSQISKHLSRNRTQCRLRYHRLKNKYNFDLDIIKRNVRYKPLHKYEKDWFKNYFNANGNEKSLQSISKNLSLIKKRGRKGRSGTVIENQLIDFFCESYTDTSPIFRNPVIRDETKLEEAAKVLKNILDLFKANLNFPKSINERFVRSKDTNLLANDNLVRLILHVAKLYNSEKNEVSQDVRTVNLDEECASEPSTSTANVAKEVSKSIEYDPNRVQISDVQVQPILRKTYNRATMSSLIHSELREFYVEPKPENFVYSQDFEAALTSTEREFLQQQNEKSLSKQESERLADKTACPFVSVPCVKPSVDYMLPPSIVSLIGLRTFMLGRKKLWKMIGIDKSEDTSSGPNQSLSASQKNSAFSNAHKLAISRITSLLFWPLFLSSHCPTKLGYTKGPKSKQTNKKQSSSSARTARNNSNEIFMSDDEVKPDISSFKIPEKANDVIRVPRDTSSSEPSLEINNGASTSGSQAQPSNVQSKTNKSKAKSSPTKVNLKRKIVETPGTRRSQRCKKGKVENAELSESLPADSAL